MMGTAPLLMQRRQQQMGASRPLNWDSRNTTQSNRNCTLETVEVRWDLGRRLVVRASFTVFRPVVVARPSFWRSSVDEREGTWRFRSRDESGRRSRRGWDAPRDLWGRYGRTDTAFYLTSFFLLLEFFYLHGGALKTHTRTHARGKELSD